MNEHFRTPLRLLADLGIEEPEEIDLEAIAFACGALVVREPLQGCEARLLGSGERAFITVNSRSDERRQRFSIGHELGHWMHDRGRASFSCLRRDFVYSWGEVTPEKRANRFAVELLLPKRMFAPRAAGRPITLRVASEVADMFRASLTATAIRLVELGSFPSVVLLSNSSGVRWSIRHRDVPSELALRDRPGPHSAAAELLQGGEPQGPMDVDAASWCEGPEARRFVLSEDSRRVTRADVLTLLWWRDQAQILAISDAELDVPGD